MEKDVVLSISKRMAKHLQKQVDANIYLTRRWDRSLSLNDRNQFARRKKADIFISIHANASTNSNAKGIETYYLNNASDKAAKRLAAQENRLAPKALSTTEHILSTMLQNVNTDESRQLAKKVQSSLIKDISKDYSDVENRKVRSALFYVLVGAKCPAILVESSFISNASEERRLMSGEFQEQFAHSVAKGVMQYLVNKKGIKQNNEITQ